MAAERFPDAAREFGRAAAHFEETDLRASAILSKLGEAECWTRAGRDADARKTLKDLDELSRNVSLDESVRESLSAATRALADSEGLARLRQDLAGLIG